MDDLFFMKMALDLAENGRGFTSPNPMVGAVVVKDGKVVGKGYHAAAGKAHAEINAIDNAKMDAKGAVLYVTLEPCNHFGKTPPCTEKIIKAGIRRVVSAMKDPNPDVKGGGAEYLRNKGIEVEFGVCESEAKRQNEVFIKYVEQKRPFVIVKCASTLDGRIATKTGDSKWVTCEESRQFVHRLRHFSDAVMVGIDTVKRDDPKLTARIEGSKCLDPARVILDSRLSISEDAILLQQHSDSDTIIVISDSVSDEALLQKKRRLETKGIKFIESPTKGNLIDLEPLMNILGSMEITSLLIEGGSRVISSAFSAGIVDKIFFFFAPKILGGNGVPICSGPGPALMSGCIPVKEVAINRFGNDILIEGYI
ncbi:MAG: bifunctional diaminohydroxyphosphoribosylaminopyrimidine deaminase/5-amino-6-(5-phosphoribosylamino)uracil reductase RibD [Proteobacteria bacterium]|nr:bifunctional diaminohydroxyphosphoribosylaminopyrimidine deaminase/5-amino-6-(5-phosphoribosylamino)uracil reductase RibD [Pseudomonadota bacterium]MBU1713901.1 bifunctional diaminohydroxyphosphoribosylaminopyrimidine deaminase/5-amino-6-(5-phosphoribosylamino)uracil reductase RibD [Pseudomonadota bacterium]